MLELGRLYYTRRGFDLHSSLEKVSNQSHGIKLQNNMHPSSLSFIGFLRNLENCNGFGQSLSQRAVLTSIHHNGMRYVLAYHRHVNECPNLY